MGIGIVELHNTAEHLCAEAVLAEVELEVGQFEEGIRILGVDVQTVLEEVVGLAQVAGQFLLDALLIEVGEAARIGGRHLRPNGMQLPLLPFLGLKGQGQQCYQE